MCGDRNVRSPNSLFKTCVYVLLTLLGRTVMVLVSLCGFAALGAAQSADPLRTQTMRPVIRGRVAAVSSMRAQATETARRSRSSWWRGTEFAENWSQYESCGETEFPFEDLAGLLVVLSRTVALPKLFERRRDRHQARPTHRPNVVRRCCPPGKGQSLSPP